MATERPSVWAELRAMAREAVNDVRGTVHETYFGRPEKPQELGVPLSPTSQQVTQEQEAGPSPRGRNPADAGMEAGTDGYDRHLEQQRDKAGRPEPEPDKDLDRG